MDFTRQSTQKSIRKNYTVELHELEALAKALDTQKELAERAFYIHREATRNSQHLHDPEVRRHFAIYTYMLVIMNDWLST